MGGRGWAHLGGCCPRKRRKNLRGVRSEKPHADPGAGGVCGHPAETWAEGLEDQLTRQTCHIQQETQSF